jgi:hypothetical protein
MQLELTFFPTEDQGVCPRKHEYIQTFVAGVDCGLDSSVGLSPTDDRLPLGVAASCENLLAPTLSRLYRWNQSSRLGQV